MKSGSCCGREQKKTAQKLAKALVLVVPMRRRKAVVASADKDLGFVHEYPLHAL
ncbi:hypothetical protein KO498_01360 [Lentibacter algarum]|uniref:hypothetical protein n=1 Tax=Lentibacter algarum TaxID=576131 RepID=UPI001C07E4FB|nr:hypothetical protein [Lentibacter algarum]MBU2980448.1 hypothetical protein [Lentibacter algarum]